MDLGTGLNTHMIKFAALLSGHYMRNFVTKPTRGPNILDLMCINDNSLFGGFEIEQNGNFIGIILITRLQSPCITGEKEAHMIGLHMRTN